MRGPQQADQEGEGDSNLWHWPWRHLGSILTLVVYRYCHWAMVMGLAFLMIKMPLCVTSNLSTVSWIPQGVWHWLTLSSRYYFFLSEMSYLSIYIVLRGCLILGVCGILALKLWTEEVGPCFHFLVSVWCTFISSRIWKCYLAFSCCLVVLPFH